MRRAEFATALSSGDYDSLVVVAAPPFSASDLPPIVADEVARAAAVDAALTGEARAVTCVPSPTSAGGRLVVSTTGRLAAWELDARAFSAAAAAGVTRALAAGSRRPLVVVAAPRDDARFSRGVDVAVLGALGALWRPLELRADRSWSAVVDAIGFVLDEADAPLDMLLALEQGRIVARDVCGTEPERMCPEGIATYCEDVFAGGPVEVSVVRDPAAIARDFPLIAAVGRASAPVERQWPRVVRLEYEGAGPTTRTLYFAGKGLTYDTGGADLKTDGHMAGMSRDKGGAAAVAGLFRVLAERRPRGVRAIGLLGAVRNDVGPNGFVSDEIIVARSGVRVRIGNTDAEGRLVLADLLAALREEAAHDADALLFSIATLTGHAALSYGPYTAVLENGPARQRGIVDAIVRAGDAYADPFERSRLRPEDYAFIAPKSPAEDVVSCNSLASSRTPRGHQFPAAFLDLVSGLRAHNARAAAPLSFVHIDMAGTGVAAGTWATGVPTGAPVVALAQALELV